MTVIVLTPKAFLLLAASYATQCSATALGRVSFVLERLVASIDHATARRLTTSCTDTATSRSITVYCLGVIDSYRLTTKSVFALAASYARRVVQQRWVSVSFELEPLVASIAYCDSP